MKVHDLKPAPGSRKRAKRVARGIGGKGGKTAGRGMKGQRARNTVRESFELWHPLVQRNLTALKADTNGVGFEGGQIPLHQRVPKLKGFKNPFRVEYQAVNLDTIEQSGLDEVTPESLRAQGLVGKNSLVKVLGRGEVSRAVTVSAHAFSASAEEAITAAGGTIEKLPKPFAVRPAASGNALMNR